MTHKDLEVWSKSMLLSEEIYRTTKQFPISERYCLSSQMRRAVVSIVSNIAEGCARRNTKELIQFHYVSLGSTAELETQLLLAQRLGFLPNDKSSILKNTIAIRRMLLALINSLKNKL